MPSPVEAGTRLAGRYRLDDPVRGVDSDPVVTWCATDEILQRPVTVQVISSDAPYASAVVDAARRAAALDDPRFLAILDAATADGLAYVVSESAQGRTLAELVSAGPLPPAEARRVAVEVARALAAAHDGGLVHRRISPGSVLRTDSGWIKVAGLGVDAALAGLTTTVDAHAVTEDTEGSAAVLYAALTSRWPLPTHGHGPTTHGRPDALVALPPAPRLGGLPCSPRQVRAAVPADLDDVVRRALPCGTPRAQEALVSPAEMAAALGAPTGFGFDTGTGPVPVVTADGAEVDATQDSVVALLATSEQPGWGRRVGPLVAGALLASGLALLGGQLVVGLDAAPAAAPAAPTSVPPSAESPTASATSLPELPTGTLLPVASAQDFDPQGQDGEENPDRVGRALDGDRATEWTTQTYFNRPFGGIKDGVGLLLDLGEVRDVATVTVSLRPGTGIELRVPGGAPDGVPETEQGFTVVADADATGSLVTLAPTDDVRTRYLLLWLTTLPSEDANTWRGGIRDIEVRS